MLYQKWTAVVVVLATLLCAVLAVSVEPHAEIVVKSGLSIEIDGMGFLLLLLALTLPPSFMLGSWLSNSQTPTSNEAMLSVNNQRLFALRVLSAVILALPLLLLALDLLGGLKSIETISEWVTLQFGSSGAGMLSQMASATYGLFLAIFAIDLFMAPIQSASLREQALSDGARHFVERVNAAFGRILGAVEKVVGANQLPATGDLASERLNEVVEASSEIESFQMVLDLLPLAADVKAGMAAPLKTLAENSASVVHTLDFLRRFEPESDRRKGADLASRILKEKKNAAGKIQSCLSELKKLNAIAIFNATDPGKLESRVDILAESWGRFEDMVRSYYSNASPPATVGK